MRKQTVRVLGMLLLFLFTEVWGQLPENVDFDQEPPPPGVLTLKESLVTALTKHPSLREGLARIEAEEFGVRASRGPWFPSFSFSASAGQTGSQGQPGGQSVVRTGLQRSYGYGVSLSQQLVDFGRTHHNIRSSELQLGLTRLSYLQTRQTVLDNVVQSYFNLLRQMQAIKTGEENVRNAWLVLKRAQGFLEAGTGAKIEVIQAEADLANAKFVLIQAQGGYGRARASLAQAMGLEYLTDLEPVETELELPDWEIEVVRQYAQTKRPDVASASLSVALAETRIRLAKAEYYPTLSANAGYNWNDSVFPPNNTIYSVGLSLSVPLINEPGLSSAVGAAKANHQAAIEQFRAVELQAIQEAASSLYSLREARGRENAAGEALEAAQENYRLASERYKVGVGNSLEVSQAQRQLVEARTQELQARYDVQNAISTLLRTTGQLDSAALLPEEFRLEPVFEIPPTARPRE
jgi:outer membrane protein